MVTLENSAIFHAEKYVFEIKIYFESGFRLDTHIMVSKKAFSHTNDQHVYANRFFQLYAAMKHITSGINAQRPTYI
ncbi:hypothetical protein K5D33_02810 [Pseudomonas cichorii]|nr:hypothetical protein [Pseudomonas cichorii]MBX8533642.1 hypothetical protein [Pseudomonas cichorii]